MSLERTRQYVSWINNDGVATVTLHNGPLNVLCGDVSVDLLNCVDEIGNDPAVRAVVVTGAGERAFSAGGDIKEFPRVLREENAEEFWKRNRVPTERLSALPHPTVAAINGLAYGGGFEITLACDLRIASVTSRFCLPEIKIGLFPDGGATQRLPRLVGASRAKLLMFLGEPITAEEAFRIGLIDRIVTGDEVVSAAQDMARRLADMPVPALRAIKTAVDEGLSMDLASGLRLEGELFNDVFQTEDAKEGINAFIEKRSPRFKRVKE